MILPVYIDTSDIFSQFEGITQNNVDNLCDAVAKGLAIGYAQKLEEEAQKALHQTRKRYIQNIRLIDEGKLVGCVLLDFSKDPLIRMIEEGASEWDMKDSFFASAKVKYTKDGRKYLTIPFRWSTPNAIGDSDAFSGQLPEEVYEVIKSKQTTIPVSGGGTRSEGLKIGEIPDKYRIPQKRLEIKNDDGNVLYKEYQHRNSLYEGLTKVTDNVTGQNSYHSFRRVSEPGISSTGEKVGSDPDAFIHPGIEAHNLISVALQNFNVGEQTGRLLNVELSKLGFEVE